MEAGQEACRVDASTSVSIAGLLMQTMGSIPLANCVHVSRTLALLKTLQVESDHDSTSEAQLGRRQAASGSVGLQTVRRPVRKTASCMQLGFRVAAQPTATTFRELGLEIGDSSSATAHEAVNQPSAPGSAHHAPLSATTQGSSPAEMHGGCKAEVRALDADAGSLPSNQQCTTGGGS